MAQGRVQVLNSVSKNIGEDGWELCFQWVRYILDDGTLEMGYRFIWKRPNGNLQAARGQARIPSLEIAKELMKMAEDQGWGNNTGDLH